MVHAHQAVWYGSINVEWTCEQAYKSRVGVGLLCLGTKAKSKRKSTEAQKRKSSCALCSFYQWKWFLLNLPENTFDNS